MLRSYFIPARNSRHRIAALALYRALLKEGKKVPLPKNLKDAGPVHPVVHLVRKRFAKNTKETSLRLVYAAMAAGYKFLTLFSKAQTYGSPEHKQIAHHLHQRKDEAAASRAINPPKLDSKPEPKHGPPILTKVSKPGESPKYTSTVRPRPRSELSGERKIPKIFATSEGIPFLRLKKPQPRALSRSLGRKTKAYVTRIQKIMDLEEDGIPQAMSEDNWDATIKRQMKQEKHKSLEGADDMTKTYKWNAQLGRRWLEQQVDDIHKDWTARGRAMSEIIAQEEALAQKEKNDPATPKEPTERELDEPQRQRAPVNEVSAEQEKEGSKFEDPFLSEDWQNKVRKLEGGETLFQRGSEHMRQRAAGPTTRRQNSTNDTRSRQAAKLEGGETLSQRGSEHMLQRAAETATRRQDSPNDTRSRQAASKAKDMFERRLQNSRKVE